jgi:hypothetical protein
VCGVRILRRLVVVAFIAVAVAALIRQQRRRIAPSADPAPAPIWPPLPTTAPAGIVNPEPAEADPPARTEAIAAPTTTTWVLPIDGSCPAGYPVKANARSGIYHVPGGRFYERTIPERCYATAADAEHDGYRAALA